MAGPSALGFLFLPSSAIYLALLAGLVVTTIIISISINAQIVELHHATEGKEGGVSFGFVFARDPKVLKRELKAQREAGVAKVREAI